MAVAQAGQHDSLKQSCLCRTRRWVSPKKLGFRGSRQVEAGHGGFFPGTARACSDSNRENLCAAGRGIRVRVAGSCPQVATDRFFPAQLDPRREILRYSFERIGEHLSAPRFLVPAETCGLLGGDFVRTRSSLTVGQFCRRRMRRPATLENRRYLRCRPRGIRQWRAFPQTVENRFGIQKWLSSSVRPLSSVSSLLGLPRSLKSVDG